MKRRSHPMERRVDYAEILDVFLWAVDKLMRPTLNNLLQGYEESYSVFRHDNLLRRMQQENLLVRRGRGHNAWFILTAEGQRRALVSDPMRQWNRTWDGSWRVVTFDLPETRRKDRLRLWKTLRAHRLGLLQRSVWIWPDELEPILTEIVRAEGIPECFCGFEARRVFLCTDAEIVAAAWDWEEIARRQQGCLQSIAAKLRVLEKIRELPRLAAEARSERQAFLHAMELDPLLPRELWPRNYMGNRLWEEHIRFRRGLHQLWRRLQPTENLSATNPSKFGNDRFPKVMDSAEKENVVEG